MNALFSGLSGLVMSAFSPQLAIFMGLPSSGELLFVGVNLMAFAAFLVWLSLRPMMPRPLVWAVVFSDIAWVLFSIIGVTLIPHQLTQLGVFLIVDVAVIVAGFAICQTVFLSRSRATDPKLIS